MYTLLHSNDTESFPKNFSVGILGNMLSMQESWLKVQILINLVCALFLTSVLKRELHAPSTPSIIIDISIEIFGVESLSL